MTAIGSPPDRVGLSVAARRAVLVAAVLGTALAYMSDDMLNLSIPWVAQARVQARNDLLGANRARAEAVLSNLRTLSLP